MATPAADVRLTLDEAKCTFADFWRLSCQIGLDRRRRHAEDALPVRQIGSGHLDSGAELCDEVLGDALIEMRILASGCGDGV